VISDPLIAVVGVCASGKSTLVEALHARGYQVREVSQEHSYVSDMWQRITNPDILIYLDAGLEAIRQRRTDDQWPQWIRDLQVARLRHARRCCDLYVLTDLLPPKKVANLALALLQARSGA
jgi:deoxyadenosine/deoxycytidine kinase